MQSASALTEKLVATNLELLRLNQELLARAQVIPQEKPYRVKEAADADHRALRDIVGGLPRLD